MPAPLAKGLIIAASVLVAAGIAVYENPQVREWVDKSRRRIALALYNLGDDIQPGSSHDVDANAAIEAAKRKRDEIMATNRGRFLRRQLGVDTSKDNSVSPESGYTSFDDFLNRDENGAYTLRNTSAKVDDEHGLRKRGKRTRIEVTNAEMGTDLLTEEQAQLIFDRNLIGTSEIDEDRQSTATLASSGNQRPVTTPAGQDHLLNDSVSHQRSLSSDASPRTQDELQYPVNAYSSFNEWAEDISSFHSATPHQQAERLADESTRAPSSSLSASMQSVHSFSSVENIRCAPQSDDSNASDAASHGTPFDILSEDSFEGTSTRGIDTPSSWTEVGSEVSEGDLGYAQ
ncbi:MAG: hypothetical protein M1837_003820 [Sclerophora amabilis]|nr:MAG: hypothetical protein M1837_003820 [Sclerophora amabilis]